MKTAGRENPNRGVAWPCNRAHGAVGQNRSRSIKWAEKQENFQPKETCFFLTHTGLLMEGVRPRNLIVEIYFNLCNTAADYFDSSAGIIDGLPRFSALTSFEIRYIRLPLP